MKTKLRRLIVIRPSAVAVAAAAALALSTVAGRANLLANPGFDSGTADRVSASSHLFNCWKSNAAGTLMGRPPIASWLTPGI